MPRLRVIVLERDAQTDTFRYVLWADVPAARQSFYAQPAGTKSAWKDALPADNTNLENGSVAERVDIQRVPPGSTMPQVQAHLETRWNSYQTDINNANPWQRYGTTWDGVAWTVINNG